MDDARKDSEAQPTFVVDEAAGAGTEKPAVAADHVEHDGEGTSGPQQEAPSDFAVQDAVHETATDTSQGDLTRE